jgi:hypothetical protein
MRCQGAGVIPPGAPRRILCMEKERSVDAGVAQSRSTERGVPMRKLIRFFTILAVGAIWPLLSALLIMPLRPPDKIWLPFAQGRFPLYDFLTSVWSSSPGIALFGLPFVVLAYVSILRNRLGFAFWCSAVPTFGLIFSNYASFLNTAVDGVKIGLFGMALDSIEVAVVAVVCACVGGMIQLVWDWVKLTRQPTDGKDNIKS